MNDDTLSHDEQFWLSCERYHELAEAYERGVQIVSPPTASGGANDCWWCYHCPWCATNVTYIKYKKQGVL